MNCGTWTPLGCPPGADSASGTHLRGLSGGPGEGSSAGPRRWGGGGWHRGWGSRGHSLWWDSPRTVAPHSLCGSAAEALQAISVFPVKTWWRRWHSRGQCHRPGREGFLSKTRTHHTPEKGSCDFCPQPKPNTEGHHHPKLRISIFKTWGNHKQVLSYLGHATQPRVNLSVSTGAWASWEGWEYPRSVES